MSIVVFWIQKGTSEMFPGWSEPKCRSFKDIELVEALAFCHIKRQEEGVSHVTLSSQLPDQVGKPGVDAVEDGKLPDGTDYGWKKRRA